MSSEREDLFRQNVGDATSSNDMMSDHHSDEPATGKTATIGKGLRFPREHCLKALTDWTLFPKLLNISEASWLTQVPVKTLYKWSSDGKLQGIAKTIGKQLRFDRDALLRMWVHEGKTAK